jgi:hypothetical protein
MLNFLEKHSKLFNILGNEILNKINTKWRFFLIYL